MRFVRETEIEDLWVAGILGFGWQKERREAEFVKEPNLNESELKLGFFRTITSIDSESVEETQKLEIKVGLAGLTETCKIWDFEWSFLQY